MISLQGKIVCGGRVSGTVTVFRRKTESEGNREQVCTADEPNRLEEAVEAVREQLSECARQAKSEPAREIFEVHRMMLEDEDVLEQLRCAVREDGMTAQKAVAQTEQVFSQMFRDTGDEVMIARIDDIRDVCGRLTAFPAKPLRTNRRAMPCWWRRSFCPPI